MPDWMLAVLIIVAVLVFCSIFEIDISKGGGIDADDFFDD